MFYQKELDLYEASNNRCDSVFDTNWCCLFSRWLSSNILISSSIKMVNVKVSGFCCRPWISTQNITGVQGLQALITIVLNLYIFYFRYTDCWHTRYLWIRARYENDWNIERGAKRINTTPGLCSDPWCGQDWCSWVEALWWSLAVILHDGWLVLPWPMTRSSNEHCFKSIMMRSEVLLKGLDKMTNLERSWTQ